MNAGKSHRIRTEADIRHGLAQLLALDPRLGPIAAEAGPLPLRLLQPGLDGLVGIITGQMISRASADAILKRFRTLVQPMTAEALRDADVVLFRQAGQSRAKERALRAIAVAVIDGTLDLTELETMEAGTAIRHLTSVPGIGPWTAEVYLLFCLGHADIFPAHDVALQSAVAEGLGLAERPDHRALRIIAESWAPWRGIAARLFWASYAARRGRSATPA